MDNLSQIISLFSEKEVKEFRSFIQRQKQMNKRKDLELFELLLVNEKDHYQAFTHKKYNGNLNAYHAIRKRLYKHLIDFVVLKQTANDVSEEGVIMNYLSVSSYFFQHNMYSLAWRYLSKAEKSAIESENYQLLNKIYNSQLEHFTNECPYKLEKIIYKKKANKILSDEDERITEALTVIRKLFHDKLSGKNLKFSEIIEKVLKVYNLTNRISERPKVFYSISAIIRSNTLIEKDFKKFIPFLIKNYEKSVKNKFFTKTNHNYKLEILYMICHALFRNKQFKESLAYLKEFEEEILRYSKVHYLQFYPKYVLLYSAILNYSGKIEEAISLLENSMKGSGFKNDAENNLDKLLNISVYYFNTSNFSKANTLLMTFPHSDKWCEKKKGKDWLLRKLLIEVLIQYELENIEIALGRIKYIENYFRNEFQTKAYEKSRIYLSFIKEFILQSGIEDMKYLQEKSRKQLELVPQSEMGIQSTAFYCWIKSKIEKKEYYSVLLKEMKSN